MKILLVEDEKSLSNVLQAILIKKGYVVDAVYNGLDGLDYALEDTYDLILLDIMMPKMDGLEMLKQLRNSKISTPVILLTAKGELEDKITGLDFGADDYITKPFETEELMARIRSVLRRKELFIGDTISLGNLTLDKGNLTFATSHGSIKVSTKEFAIMELLITNQNQIISKEQFIDKVWGYDFNGEYNSVEVYISFIRKKLKAIVSNVFINAQRGAGYFLEVKSND
ncbi:MAG TPA: response regulator transcription factor [Anaerovoracaceae bacterium]|nr:response regulator transcription factor [Anaerovoracaceae bacterium]